MTEWATILKCSLFKHHLEIRQEGKGNNTGKDK
jgi:hypothetical protein